MEKQYPIEQEAQTEADRLNKEHRRVDVFCPLIKESCRTDCECFCKAYVRKPLASTMNGRFIVQGFNCQNGMFVEP